MADYRQDLSLKTKKKKITNQSENRLRRKMKQVSFSVGLKWFCFPVLVAFCLTFYALFVSVTTCCAGDNTDLMFVGETLKVITIASGREEGAWKAPVIADVITQDQIEQRSASGLGDLLDSEPGFYISPREAGYGIYLRGISDSVLFFYDSVPVGTGISKNYTSINPYLSLEAIKRVEIIKGPASVLWGPDAFAGIINVVPLTGKDFQGAETGISAGSSSGERKAYFRSGMEKGDWNWFLSMTGGRGQIKGQDEYNIVRFWETDLPSYPASPEQRQGSGILENPEYFELTGNTGLNELLKLSTNFFFYNMPYTRLEDGEEKLVWKEENQTFSGFVKLEGSKKYSISSGFRWTAYWDWADARTKIVDLDLENQDRVFFGELVHEKTVWNGDGLMTTGVSLRQEDIQNLPVWVHYYPEYFSSDNQSFLPWVNSYGYSVDTASVFGQYQHTIRQMDFWAGIRGDDHKESGVKWSYNFGFSWNPSDQWGIKTAYGNAYRTPVARQLQEGKTEMENIESLSVQTEWKPTKRVTLDMTGFISQLRDGYVQDAALGLSETIDRDLYGMELKARYSPVDELDLGTGVSWVKGFGEDTHFRYNDYYYYENGEIVKHYTDIYEPYDIGPELLFSTDLIFRISDRVHLRAEGRYASKRTARFLLDEDVHTYGGVWLFDTSLKLYDPFRCSMDVDIVFKNLFDCEYTVPGSYGPIQGEGASLEIKIEKRF